MGWLLLGSSRCHGLPWLDLRVYSWYSRAKFLKLKPDLLPILWFQYLDCIVKLMKVTSLVLRKSIKMLSIMQLYARHISNRGSTVHKYRLQVVPASHLSAILDNQNTEIDCVESVVVS